MRTRVLALWTAALLATAVAFVAHLTLRFENVRLGYEVGEARREQRELAAAQRLLSLEAATLTQPERVEAFARRSFRMDVVDAERVTSMDAPAPTARPRSVARPAKAPATAATAKRAAPRAR